jgi:repressor LexA
MAQEVFNMDLYYDNAIFANNLKRQLEAKGMTGAELSRRLGCSKSLISDYLKRRKLPRMDKVDKMCVILNCSREDLICKTEESVAILDEYKVYAVPRFDSAAAGFGMVADSAPVGTDYLPFKSQFEADETMTITVRGDSMFPKIEDGDIIAVRRQDSVDSGTVAVVLIDGTDAVVKKVTYGNDFIILHSFNPEYMDREFRGAEVQRIRVLGKVTKVIKEM